MFLISVKWQKKGLVFNKKKNKVELIFVALGTKDGSIYFIDASF